MGPCKQIEVVSCWFKWASLSTDHVLHHRRAMFTDSEEDHDAIFVKSSAGVSGSSSSAANEEGHRTHFPIILLLQPLLLSRLPIMAPLESWAPPLQFPPSRSCLAVLLVMLRFLLILLLISGVGDLYSTPCVRRDDTLNVLVLT